MSEIQNLSDKSISQLYGLLEDYQVEGESAFFKSCRVLYQLDKKGDKRHPLLKKAIYKHYEVVFEKKVTPAIVLYFNGSKKFIERMKDYRDTMVGVSSDNKFPVAVVEKGEIVQKEQSGHQMSWSTFDRLFPGNGVIRSYSEQWVILNAELEEKRQAEEVAETERKDVPVLPRIRAVEDKIVVKDEEFSIEEIKEFLKTLGYNVVKLPKG